MQSDEEPECRVCRGDAEDGRVLYAPCRCRGSIKYVHQDCLEQVRPPRFTRHFGLEHRREAAQWR
eukprot:scaffold1397_cov254-Pinguiococcus_pyrenoidosus.AAC.34